MAGIPIATLLNHALAATAGAWLASLISPQFLNWIIALSFIGFALWTLKPDVLNKDPRIFDSGIFLTTLTAFFMAEMGDKTQFATWRWRRAMSRYIPFVILGTTLGMILANAPAVRTGKALAGRIDMRKVRWLAATLFLLMGMGTLASGTTFG